jgi:hypothetical protein
VATILENRKVWSEFDWRQQGEEFSRGWGGTEPLWWGTLWPRIHAFLPVSTILEIAPGFGRCTEYLKDQCDHLWIVDLNERCIEACRRRFAACDHISYHVNDGKSLKMVPAGSIDFAFSYDSLVHVDADVIGAYLVQLKQKLTPNGVAFLHHSNIGEYVRPRTGKLAFYVQNKFGSNWRAEDMTASKLRTLCHDAGLVCVGQELVVFYPEESLRASHTFHGPLRYRTRALIDRHYKILNDCFSIVTCPGSRWERPTRVVVNKTFWRDVKKLSLLGHLYSVASFQAPSTTSAP